MNNFTFQNPTKIIFGKDTLRELTKEIPKGEKILLTYGQGSLKKNGTLQKIQNELKNHQIIQYGGIEPNPHFDTLMNAVDLIKQHNITYLLAAGGGSVIDGTKFIALIGALAKTEHHNPTELRTIAKQHLTNYTLGELTKALPLATILTIPATGSEMNKGGVISLQDGKYHFANNLSYPQFSILDPTLTYSLPEDQIANGIIDAYVHVLEVYVTQPNESRLQDRMAEGLLKTLLEIGPITQKEPENYNARANLIWCATIALNGILGTGVPQDWSAHMIGHELTARFGIPHGRTLACLIPAIFTELQEQKHQKLLQYANRVLDINNPNEKETIKQAIEQTKTFFQSLGVPTQLQAYGIKKEQLEDIIDALRHHGMTHLSETGSITLEKSRTILHQAYSEQHLAQEPKI